MMNRSSRRRMLSITAVAVLAGAMVAGAAVPASAATTWVLQSTPNPASGTLNMLTGVSCPSAANCVAVGSQQTSAGVSTALAEHWNGSAWSLQTAVNPSGDTAVSINDVSCPSATYCIAVGVNQPTVQSSTAIAESWNGSTWTLQSPVSPAKAWLSAISCTATNNCEAVGRDGAGPLAEHWNGSAWSAQTVPSAVGDFTAVSCVSASFCEGVSGNGTADAESWNGSTWSTQTFQAGTPFAVSCTSASNCEAVGYEIESPDIYALAEHWNGSTWAYQTTVSPDSDAGFYAVSCVSASDCTAAGTYATTSGDGATLAENWNGSTWTEQSTPNPSGYEEADFQGISCPSTTDCTAVGDWYATSPSLARTLGEQGTS
jgi:hypothetical protein